MFLKRELRVSYLRDADAVGLVMKCGCVVIHVPDLYVHLPCDHLVREGGRDLVLAWAPGLFLPKGLGSCLPGRQGPQGTLTPWWSLTENSTVNSDLV